MNSKCSLPLNRLRPSTGAGAERMPRITASMISPWVAVAVLVSASFAFASPAKLASGKDPEPTRSAGAPESVQSPPALSPQMTVQRIEALIAQKGPSALLCSQLGYARYRNHQPDKSLDAFTAMLKFRQPNADELRIIALDYVELRDLQSADKWLRASLKLNASDWRTWRYLGGVQFSEELIADATTSFRECLKLDPDNALAEDGLARSLEAQGNAAEAHSHFELANKLNLADASPSPLPLLHYGEFLFRQQKNAQALQELTAAAKLAPNDSETHEYLSQVYQQTGQMSPALKQMRMASQLRPESPRLHLLLGRLYRQIGNRIAADREIKLYVQLSREHKEDWDR